MRRNTKLQCVKAAAAAFVLLSVTHTPRAQAGRGVFYDVSATGVLAPFKLHNPWRKTWHQIVPGKFGGSNHTDLFFYDRQRGEGKFFTTDGKGNLKLIKRHTGWRRTWDMIIPGEFGGALGTDLLFYDARNRLARVYSVSASGNITLLKQHTGWQDWDVILPIRIGGSYHTDLFLYSRTRGQAKFFRTDGKGNLLFVKQYQFLRGWDQIVPGNFDGDGYTDLMFYRRVIGDARIYALNDKANIKLLRAYTGLRKTWDLIVPGRFGGSSQTDLLFYDRTVGQARTANVHNGFMALQPVRRQGKSWHRIIPGFFNSKNLEDVLCYDFTHRLRIHAIKCTNANGSRATAITPAQVQTWVDRTNEVYASAGIQFDFDPETDWQVIANDVLNRLDFCSYHPNQQSCLASRRFATAIASTMPCKVVLFFRYGVRGGAAGGAYSDPNGNYVAMPGFGTRTTRYYQDSRNPKHGTSVQNYKLLSHELGHYLGISHVFKNVDYTRYSDPHLAVLKYMQANNKKTLADMDGDRHVVYDTPPDVHQTYYLMKGWNPADLSREIRIYSSALRINITFNPDRHNVMNYFGICDDYIRVSPDQQRLVREWLHKPHRVKLLDSCSIPGLAKSFGNSCRAGMKHTVTGNPALGNKVNYRLSGAPGSKVVNLTIGLSRRTWGPFKLPLHLSIIGMPRCYAYADRVLVLRGVSDPAGNAAFSFTVPNDPRLIGDHFYSQYITSDPGANPAGITVTNAVDIRLGG
jgi:hypothetical protein